MSPPTQQGSNLFTKLSVLAAVAGLFAATIAYQGQTGRAIRALPEGERHALYQRTFDTLRSTCANDASDLTDYCREQANLIEQFPECDRDCHAAASPFLPRPTR